MPTNVTVTLREQEFNSTITESDGVLFLSVLFNDEEIAALEAGKSTEGIAMFERRQVRQMEEELKAASTSEEEEKINQKYNEVISQIIFQRIERDPVTRSIIASRIKECFRDIPDSMVYWESKKEFGIRLEPEETMSLFMQIIAPVLAREKPPLAQEKLPQENSLPQDNKTIMLENENRRKGFAPILLPDSRESSISKRKAELEAELRELEKTI